MLKIMHSGMSVFGFVIPGLTRNPVFFWVPAFAGMTGLPMIKDALCALRT
jgi:hypothetical protein